MVAQMRHYMSPEEVAKREGLPASSGRAQGFRHYNHPDEIARRAAAGEPSTAIVVPRGAPSPASVAAPAERPTSPEPGNRPLTGDQRLRRLELLVYALLESPSEAREFRLLMNNLGAVTESQATLGNRLLALEHSFDLHVADMHDELGELTAAEQDSPLPGPATEPPPALPAAPAEPAASTPAEPTT